MSAPPRRWLDDPVESGSRAGHGLYLHVPFCSHRCGYCDFATVAVGRAPDPEPFARYVEALATDLARQVASAARTGRALPALTSVFVGGGTPSLLPPVLLTRLIAAVRDECDLAPDAEWTVEANPESADAAFMEALVAGGVDRLSLGAQSFTPSVLTTLERGHDVAAIERAVLAARRAGIARVSVDLIHGAPGERTEDWIDTLRTVAALAVDHVSAYALGIHAGTPFGRAVAAGTMPAPDDDVARERFELARERLGAAGFEHYELSNWARGPAMRSQHNVLYWRHGDYLGVGVGAHAHRDGHRWWTTRSIERYLEAVEAGGTGWPDARDAAGPNRVLAGEERLSDDERATERLLLGLRLADGLHPADAPPIDPLALEDAMASGLVETACGRLRATNEGWFLLDEAVARLTP